MKALLTLDQIAHSLRILFQTDDPFATGLLLLPSQIRSDSVIGRLAPFQPNIPRSFIEVLSRYSLDNFTLGPTSFGRHGDYLREFAEWNLPGHTAWWGRGTRPTDLVLAASSEVHGVLLRLDTGEVMAGENGPAFMESTHMVARDFELFLCGIGTVFFERFEGTDKGEIASHMLSQVGCGTDGGAYWMELAS